jgi:hypothetical protein
MRFNTIRSRDLGRSARTGLAALALAGIVVPGLALAGAAPASASPATAAAAHASKPVPPPPPPSTPGAGLGNAIPAKPHRATVPRPGTAGWTVTLTASPDPQWPTEYSTLTATTNMNVGPTPYYLRIYDQTAQAWVITCGTGTTCTAPVTQPTPAAHLYVAVVSDSSVSYPPGSEQASSAVVDVQWQGIGVTLTASPATVPVGSATTLTATTSADVGPSPFYTEIFDVTTQTLVKECGSGTTCSAPFSRSVAATDKFIAYESSFDVAYPPAGIQEASAASYVTWSNLGWQVTLSAPATSFGTETVTATANGNVGPSPYYIEIFNENGTRLADCSSGSVCAVQFTPTIQGATLIAFVSGNGTAFPPAGIVATSNAVRTYLQIFT